MSLLQEGHKPCRILNSFDSPICIQLFVKKYPQLFYSSKKIIMFFGYLDETGEVYQKYVESNT